MEKHGIPRSGRRRFLWLIGGTGALLAAQPWPATDTTETASLRRVSRRSRALGAEVSITVLHSSADAGRAAIDAAFRELAIVESVMSIYDPASQVSRLNATGALDDPHPYLLRVLRHATELSAATDGAFDITVQPLWEIYHRAAIEGALPDAASIAKASACIDWRRVDLSPHRVILRGHGTAITLNGIAQGFAADRAVAALRAHGVAHALIDTGEMAALGAKENGQPWNVGIQHPRQADAFLALANLQERCLATSGDYATRFADGYARHHLFDPRTGTSPRELSSVSVAAATAMEADALSTAVFVLGKARGLRAIEAVPGADALLVGKDGTMVTTAGFPARTDRA